MSASQPELTLYHTPGACSRVTMNALEELALAFEDRPVNIFKGAQFSPDYRAINPKAKIPALVVGDALLTETPAIILWLTETVPGETLLPGATPLERAQAFADLVWCSNTLHPLARTIRMPNRATTGDPAPVAEAAVTAMTPLLASVEARLAQQPWWFGARWSVVDVYLSWVLGMCEGGIDLSQFPALVAHREQVRARPSFQRALERETRAM
eukprot:gene22940-24256_t